LTNNLPAKSHEKLLIKIGLKTPFWFSNPVVVVVIGAETKGDWIEHIWDIYGAPSLILSSTGIREDY